MHRQYFFVQCPLSLLQVSFTVDRDPLLPTGCVNRTPSHSYFLAHSFAHMHLHSSRSSVCVRDRTIHIPSMFAHERSSSSSRSHSPPLTVTSSSWTTSSTITSEVALPINKPSAQDPQNDEYGSVANNFFYNKPKEKEYLIFQCKSEQDKMTHWIQQSANI